MRVPGARYIIYFPVRPVRRIAPAILSPAVTLADAICIHVYYTTVRTVIIVTGRRGIRRIRARGHPLPPLPPFNPRTSPRAHDDVQIDDAGVLSRQCIFYRTDPVSARDSTNALFINLFYKSISF